VRYGGIPKLRHCSDAECIVWLEVTVQVSSVQAPCISMVPRRVHEVPCPKEQARQRPLLFPFPCCPVPRYMSSVSVPPALVSRLQRMYLLSPGTGCHLLDQAIYSSRLVLESLQGLGWVGVWWWSRKRTIDLPRSIHVFRTCHPFHPPPQQAFYSMR